MKIGFIGLGNLGTPIAINLQESGHMLYVYNRTKSKTLPLTSKGAVACESIAALAKECKIVFSIVSDDAALKTVCESEDGLIKNLEKGSIHISMSTILPQTAKDISVLHTQHQQYYISAPVFGRPEMAMARKLNFVYSGDQAIRSEIEPLLQNAGASGVWDFGNDVMAANTVKLCGNFLIASMLESIGESVNLAKKSNVDPQKMWDMLTQTLFNVPLYKNYSNIVIQQKFTPPAFTAKLGLKDMLLVLEQAAIAKQSMPLAELLRNNMQQLVDSGKAELDWSAVSMSE